MYRVDDKKLKSLDELERHPTFYVRRTIPVELCNDDDATIPNQAGNNSQSEGGIIHECLCYILENFNTTYLDLTFHECYNCNLNEVYVPAEQDMPREQLLECLKEAQQQ